MNLTIPGAQLARWAGKAKAPEMKVNPAQARMLTAGLVQPLPALGPDPAPWAAARSPCRDPRGSFVGTSKAHGHGPCRVAVVGLGLSSARPRVGLAMPDCDSHQQN